MITSSTRPLGTKNVVLLHFYEVTPRYTISRVKEIHFLVIPEIKFWSFSSYMGNNRIPLLTDKIYQSLTSAISKEGATQLQLLVRPHLYNPLSPCIRWSVHPLCVQVISAPAHPHVTWIAVYPALFCSGAQLYSFLFMIK